MYLQEAHVPIVCMFVYNCNTAHFDPAPCDLCLARGTNCIEVQSRGQSLNVAYSIRDHKWIILGPVSP